MAWFHSARKKTDPLTPWEAYQAKQAKKRRHPKQRNLPLPTLTSFRRHQRTRNIILVTAPLVILLAGFGYLMSPLAKVQQVSVNGTENVPIQQVIDASTLSNRVLIPSVLLHPQRYLTRIKQALPQIASAQVKVQAVDQVTITVKEHEPIGYRLANKRYQMILANGTLIKTKTKTPLANYPVFSGFTVKEAAALAKAVAKFPPAVRRATSEVDASRGDGNPYQITMTMTDGNTVVADSRTVAKKIAYYPSIVAQVTTKGTVDLEVGAFFTPYPAKSAK